MAPTLFIAYEKASEVNVDYYETTHLPKVIEAWKGAATNNFKVYTRRGETSPYELLHAVEFEIGEPLSKLQSLVRAET
jgi:hypothetical protein